MKIAINGTTLSYEVAGEGPPVTLVHSIGLSTRHGWREQAPMLRERYRVLSYDIRGLGESEAGSAPLTTDTFVEDLRLLLQALGIERTALLGVSLGGVIAARAAARHPDLVGSLVLVSTVCRQSPEGRERLLQRNKRILASGMGVAVEEQVATHFSPAFAAAHPELMDWYRATYLANNVDVYTRIMQHLSERDICAELAAIRCPTLIVSGEEDEPSVTGRAPLEAARTLHERIPGSELHGMKGSCHYPQLDQPEEFNRVIGAFLERTWK